MWEYDMLNKHTGEEEIIFGYDFKDACRRSHIDNPSDWYIYHSEYVD